LYIQKDKNSYITARKTASTVISRHAVTLILLETYSDLTHPTMVVYILGLFTGREFPIIPMYTIPQKGRCSTMCMRVRTSWAWLIQLLKQWPWPLADWSHWFHNQCTQASSPAIPSEAS
jgi:hypothetical protein